VARWRLLALILASPRHYLVLSSAIAALDETDCFFDPRSPECYHPSSVCPVVTDDWSAMMQFLVRRKHAPVIIDPTAECPSDHHLGCLHTADTTLFDSRSIDDPSADKFRPAIVEELSLPPSGTDLDDDGLSLLQAAARTSLHAVIQPREARKAAVVAAGETEVSMWFFVGVFAAAIAFCSCLWCWAMSVANSMCDRKYSRYRSSSCGGSSSGESDVQDASSADAFVNAWQFADVVEEAMSTAELVARGGALLPLLPCGASSSSLNQVRRDGSADTSPLRTMEAQLMSDIANGPDPFRMPEPLCPQLPVLDCESYLSISPSAAQSFSTRSCLEFLASGSSGLPALHGRVCWAAPGESCGSKSNATAIPRLWIRRAVPLGSRFCALARPLRASSRSCSICGTSTPSIEDTPCRTASPTSASSSLSAIGDHLEGSCSHDSRPLELCGPTGDLYGVFARSFKFGGYTLQREDHALPEVVVAVPPKPAESPDYVPAHAIVGLATGGGLPLGRLIRQDVDGVERLLLRISPKADSVLVLTSALLAWLLEHTS